jgi:hypothetical protein
MALECFNTMRATMRYRTSSRNSSFVLTARRNDAGAIEATDPELLSYACGQWDYNTLGLGYWLLRTIQSFYERTDVYSLDSSTPYQFTDYNHNGIGFIPDILSGPLPTSCAPIMNWTVAGARRRARTYLPCLTQEVMSAGFGGDTSQLSTEAQVYLKTIFQDLYDELVLAGFTMVKLVTRSAGVELVPALRYDITGCAGPYKLMGTQRRRTRPS